MPSQNASQSPNFELDAPPPRQPPESADWKVGAFQQLPAVSPAYEIIGTALKRARMVKPSRGEVDFGIQKVDFRNQRVDGYDFEFRVDSKYVGG